MLEGVIARLLNRWLGKYVLDLDTENLNVGIFSGQVQLTELRLKPEALYELDLPIEVKFGTIGKICIQIPWNALMNQPVIVQIEDVHVLVCPVVAGDAYDPERDKRLSRASKKKVLADLEHEDGDLIGGPDSFPEHLFTSLINNLLVTIQNIHIRYEDNVSQSVPISAGLCISSLTAETTNSRWKAATCTSPRSPPNSQSATAYHLVKLESVSVYWNHASPEQKWDFESNYYGWRNMMMHSLHTFSMGGSDFEFLIKPMTCKIKFIINKSNGGRILKVLVDVMLQDLTLQLTREQYLSLCAVVDSLSRMYISRRFISIRPVVVIHKNANKWWLYAYECVLEQRVRPYTWRRIATVRANYRLYKEAYRRVLLNPNDTELKLDLQKYEDNLDIVNVVIARRHALLKLRHEQQNEEESENGQQSEKSPSTKGSLWSMLPSPEREKLCRMIGYVQTPTTEMSLTSAGSTEFHRIEHKYNLTVGNLTLGLLRSNREVLVLTLTQLLASVETVPGSGCMKVSGRAEGMVLEGANFEDHLVPLISAEHHCNVVVANDAEANASMTPNVFSIDYERCPNDSEGASCRLWCSLEAVGIVFHTHAVAELLEFLEGGNFGSLYSLNNVSDQFFLRNVPEKTIGLIRKALDNRMDLNLDIRVPYIVIPEYGAANKSGSQLIIDLGRLVVRTELAPIGDPSSLEDATQMELEEQLYSRLHVDLFQVQLLFCDSGENWRDARKEIDTEMHLMSKTNILLVFSSCVRNTVEYSALPGYKLNVTIPSLKFNVSERKIDLVLTYLGHVGKLVSEHQRKCTVLWKVARGGPKKLTMFPKDLVTGRFTLRQLVETRSSVRAPWRHRPPTCRLSAARSSRRPSDLPPVAAVGRAEPPEPSEHSEDASEAWARCVDLPGLEDNVSPSNSIKGLSRLVLGELCLVLSRSSERIDRPYLMLRIDKTCADLAVMDYGPAIQFTVASLTLTDKMHTSTTGQYLDLIHIPLAPADSPPQQELLQVLYRKVRADCPDFRSHFHSVETSFVADFGPICFVVHRDALRTLVKYTRYLHDRISRHSELISDLKSLCSSAHKYLKRGGSLDPPVPPGAVKFSHSVRLASVMIRLCDSDAELLEIRLTGFETDVMFRANERMVLRTYLTNLAVDHLAEVTLYTRVLSVDEDKVFEAKYVRHAPCPCRSSDVLAGIRSRPTDMSISADGNLRIHFGRIQITLLYKLALQLRRFLEPLIPSGRTRVAMINYVYERTIGQIKNTLSSGERIQIGLYIHGPTILLPQKTASPNLVVVHTGELTVENFFKETNGIVIENVLIRSDGATVVRAVMTLASSLEMQEVMLEPLSIRMDVKRSLPGAPRSAVPTGVIPRPPTWEIDGVIDAVKITVGQRDLSTILSVYVDNMSEGLFVELSPATTGPKSDDIPASPPPSPVNEIIDAQNDNIRNLEVFFCQGEAKHKEVSVRFLLEEMQLSLFSDCEEMLSSPVRDFTRGLCRLDIGEIHVSGDVYNDGGLEAKLSIHTLGVNDIRPEVSHTPPGINRILHAIRSQSGGHSSQQICVSMPPTVDISFHQNRTGDRFVDVIVERLCLQLSVPFVVAFGRFLTDSIPCANRRAEVGGVINHGYVADTECPVPTKKRPTTGLTLALRICRPELIILSITDADDNDRVGSIVTRTEVLVDYSRHSMRENLIISLSNLHVLYSGNSNRTGRRHSEPYVVLHPCDVEYSKSYRAEEDGTRASASISSVQVHFCPSFIHSVYDLFNDLSLRINLPWNTEPEPETTTERPHDDLWLPKRMSRSYGSGDDSGIDTDEQPIVPVDGSNNIEKGETVLVASASSLSIIIELESGKTTIPVLLLHMSAEATVHDWSAGRAHGTLELHLQSNYYNGRVGQWEPLIEPVHCQDGTHRPWQILVRVFKDVTAVPITPIEQERRSVLNGAQRKRERTAKSGSSSASGEDDGAEGSDVGSDGGMVFLRAPTSPVDKNAPRVAASLAAFLDDSDTDTEECGTMERLASAICDLFTGDWNESDGDSDGGGSSDSDQAEDSPGGDSGDTALERCRRPDGRTTTGLVRRTTYILVDSKDVLNLIFTSETIRLLKLLFNTYCCGSDKLSRTLIPQDSSAVVLANDVCPGAKVELLRTSDGDEDPQIVCSRTFEKLDSPPGTPDDSDDEYGSDIDSNADSHGSSATRRLKGYDCDWSSQGDRDPLLASLHFNPLSTTAVYRLINQEKLKIEVPGFDPITTSCPSNRSWCRLLRLEPAFRHQRYHVFVGHDTNAISGRKVIVRSPLQLRNETCHALAVFYERATLQQLGLEAVGEVVNPFGGTVRIVVLEPHDVYHVPLHLAYHCRLHVRPVGADGHHLRLRAPSAGGIWWPELAADLGSPKDIKCDDEVSTEEEETGTPFMLRAIAVEGVAQASLYKNQQQNVMSSKTIPNYLIRVVPPLSLRNRLPYAIVVHISGNQNAEKRQSLRIEAGDRVTTYTLDGRKSIRLQLELGYLGLLWTGAVTLTEETADDRFVQMATEHDTDGGNKQLTLAVRVSRRDTVVVHFYSPYWIVNRTSLPLQLRAASSNVVYDIVGEAPLLYAHRRRQRQGQQRSGGTVRIRAYQSSWSAEFSLDAAGTAGLVVCRDRERARKYALLAACAPSHSAPRLTRIVTLLPNWLVCNATATHLRYMELNERTDLWLDLPPGGCCPFWPETPGQLMCVKYRDGRVASPAFAISKPHRTALRMDNGGAVGVNVSGGGERPLTITFRPYRTGDAPVRVDNACADLYLKVCQKSTGHVTLLSPYHSLLYTWDDPNAERTLIWNVYNNRSTGHQVDVCRDGSGEVRVSVHVVRPPNAAAGPQRKSSSSATDSDDDDDEVERKRTKRRPPVARTDKLTVYWLCYMDGGQRTLLLTQEKRTIEERSLTCDGSVEMCLSLAGVGLSLCTGGPGGGNSEVLYASLSDSPPIWEVYIAHRWKTLTLELASWLEDKYLSQHKKCQLKDYVLIDLEKMYMLKPFYGELRRTYHPALWIEERTSRFTRQRKLVINCMQIDGGDQRNGPCNILRAIPPNNFNANGRPLMCSPCVRLTSVAQRTPENSKIIPYESVKVRLHEFEINLDGRLIERLLDMLTSHKNFIDICGKGEEFRRDMALVRAPLCMPSPGTIQTIIITDLTITAMKLKLGLHSPGTHRHFIKRTGTQPDPDGSNELPLILDYMYGCLESFCMPPAAQITFTVPDLEIKDLCSESFTRLRDDMKAHFISRFMQQFHVQVLGADVLLNPYGAGEEITPLPHNALTETNSERIVNGDIDLEKTARCLMGHVYGPTPLLLSLCTGEHLLRYSMEADRRRRGRYNPPVQLHIPETVTMASTGSFIYGVTLGLYGLFHRGDLEGFFRGPGRALASLMGSTRGGVANISSGSGGVADCAAVSLDAIRRAAFLGERSVNILRQRLIRHCEQQQLGLKMYSQHEGIGKTLLNLVSGGQYASDVYWAHAPLNATGKTILLITMQHVFYVENIRLWGPWDVQWAVELDDIVSVPKIIEQAIHVSVRNAPDKQDKEDGNDTQVYKVRGEQDVITWLRERLEQAMVLGMEDKCWTSEK